MVALPACNMTQSRLLTYRRAVTFLGAALLAACSSGAAGPLPPGDGNIAGGGPAPAGASAPTATSSPAPAPPTPPPASTTPPPIDADSGVPSVDAGVPVVDSGLGYFIDTSTGGSAPTGALGSCTNPACATDGNECGCQAIDSSGNAVQLGCQAGGQCVCVQSGTVDTQPFDENGACGASQTAAQQFLQYCACQ